MAQIMKVGIMSMQRVINYGSFLQAYSLKKNIEQLGHQVEFVDYKIEPPLVKNAVYLKDEQSFVQRMVYKLKFPHKKKQEEINREFDAMGAYERFHNEKYMPMLGISEQRNERPKIDAMVIGSDEVFNCLQFSEKVGYSPELFGADSKAEIILSYAASFGNTTLEGLQKYKKDKEIGEYFRKFKAISVRDKNSGNIVKKLTNKEPEYHLDPVFIWDYEELQNIRIKKDNYIVVYAYPCRLQKEECRAIMKFARKHHKEIVCLCGPQLYLDGYTACNPFEALAYIKNADYVITDTFHGSVFSIKMNKKLAVFLRRGHEGVYGNSEKLYDLLERFGLEHRILEKTKDLESVLQEEIDYQPVNEKIAAEIKKSRAYLEKNLGRG